jgi:hypothetical protein
MWKTRSGLSALVAPPVRVVGQLQGVAGEFVRAVNMLPAGVNWRRRRCVSFCRRLCGAEDAKLGFETRSGDPLFHGEHGSREKKEA